LVRATRAPVFRWKNTEWRFKSTHPVSLAHYRIAEIDFQQKNYQAAVSLGAIFNLSGQFDRAENEYR
jgi:hypothetical protein